MMLPAKVRQSTITAHSRGSVNVFVQPEKDSLEAIADAVGLLAFGEDPEEELGAGGRPM